MHWFGTVSASSLFRAQSETLLRLITTHSEPKRHSIKSSRIPSHVGIVNQAQPLAHLSSAFAFAQLHASPHVHLAVEHLHESPHLHASVAPGRLHASAAQLHALPHLHASVVHLQELPHLHASDELEHLHASPHLHAFDELEHLHASVEHLHEPPHLHSALSLHDDEAQAHFCV
ncbi:hypothetical protein IWW43_002277 [Coemansia sp. RSA 1935]|nr:hypothetical protein IWW43_002277 [Coemansia sp. RSA 1935]